ncbi:intradiol ring-cleavage dioxygenase [Methylobacterium sp. J-090]|uniref:intradiol ring-cleavage dioxygenase n=1 Tax=Methylobacterium sp. J-090 TaxID=2836666 RepID=UPI001FBA6575|nr:intradiol ring-cleavage dioxygenase [Methylobacterium sp. J-090]MCJ2083139.1 intradiol ring-cleavage dioxygenase [Methylobacterium sp. J-090]
MSFRTALSRRAALLGLTGAATALRVPAAMAAEPEGSACLLMPETVEGPFYVDPHLLRADIREDSAGLPLALRLRVIEAGPCTALSQVRVDVWHADAQGLYSGYDGQGDSRRVSTKTRTFLRGTQFSDGEGWAEFRTIYPGWYAGRATHVHFKVFVDTRSLVTGQMYFPDATSAEVYGTDAAYGGRDTARRITNGQDGIARVDDRRQIGVAAIERTDEGLRATLTIGVDRRARARSRLWPF